MSLVINTKNISFYLLLFLLLFGEKTSATSIAQSPLFLTESVPPIVMLTMGKDHKLYYEAYNDASDLNGDGVLDIRYKPGEINYFGYFDSFKCYSYTSGKFVPASKTVNKKCSNKWSGDFLNYLTTSRMDALRKVLYGGSRSTDTTSETVLKRVFIPQDGHSWGKQYTSRTVDGYDIADYAPFSEPSLSAKPLTSYEIDENITNPIRRHLFASTSLSNEGAPVLRVLENVTENHTVIDWVSKGSPVADKYLDGTARDVEYSPVDYNVLLSVCVAEDMLEENCKPYSDGTTTTYKPIGLLQRYGDDELMAFGLLTGSYRRNISGGVIRKNISSFQDEVDLNTGIFTNAAGIVDTIDKLRMVGFMYTGDLDYSYGTFSANLSMRENDDVNWGNPIAEMMYEGLRYFAGKSEPTSAFVSGVGDPGSHDSNLGLPLPSWQDPYRTTTGGYPSCTKPIQLVISDVNNSYDTDQLPGSSFPGGGGRNPLSTEDLSGLTGLTGLNVSTLADMIWAGESESTNVFIGESNGVEDGAPSAKAVNSFKNIRGLAPEEPTKFGGYYAGSVALYGKQTDIHTTAPGKQNVETIAVALASPLPNIEIPVGGKTITLLPFAKSVNEGSISPDRGSFQPTDAIVDFYVEEIVNTGVTVNESDNGGRAYGSLQINFEDLEQGNDFDMDAIAKYEFRVISDTQVEIAITAIAGAGIIVQHLGYVISGTNTDGIYLEVRDADSDLSNEVNYYLDTPPGQLPGGEWDDRDPNGNIIPLPGVDERTVRTFTVSGSDSTSASFIKHPPLWYAAKWSMINEDGTLPRDTWDSDNDGNPDGYFLVTNAGNLEQQLDKAFAEVLARPSSAASVASNSTRLDANSKIYQATFHTANWEGKFLSFDLDDITGSIAQTAEWNAATLIPSAASRKIYSYNPVTDNAFEFSDVANFTSVQLDDLNRDANGTTDDLAEQRIAFLRGDQTNEEKNSGVFRNRTSLLGDIINSDPVFVGRTSDFGYSLFPGAEGSSYINYRVSKSSRTQALYFGANDGMFHAINADDGNELFTYVPDAVIGSLNLLTSPNYGCSGESRCIPHKYYVDGPAKVGDVYIDLVSGSFEWRSVLVGTLGGGGKGLFALDVTDPINFSASDVLWEHSTTQPIKSQTKHDNDLAAMQAHLGYTLTQSSIVRMHNGSWAAIVSNGYDSLSKQAVLFILDIKTGEIIGQPLNTGVGSGAEPNGLSTPIAVDETGDRIVDSIYAGDLQGNLWKFDVSDSNPNNWKVAYEDAADSLVNVPLFVAKDEDGVRQSITAKPQVGEHPQRGQMVFFGTGQYFAINDQIVANPAKVQTFYGIQDLGAPVAARSNLQQQTITHELTHPNAPNIDVRVVSDTVVDYLPSSSSVKSGWYLDLISPVNGAEGERNVSSPLLRDGRIIFTTLIPSADPCSGGGDSWLMELDAINGGRLDLAVFGSNYGYILVDLDGDGVYEKVATSGVRIHGVGIIKTPAILATGGKGEKKYLAGTSGGVGIVDEVNRDANGRQSWRQIQ